jgi:hypothetical protein
MPNRRGAVRQGVVRGSMIDSVDDWANGVEWTGEAPHLLAGSLRTRSAFLAHTIKRFGEALPQGTLLRIERVFVDTHFAVVTMWFLPMAGGEWHRYWWICGRGFAVRTDLSVPRPSFLRPVC